MARSPTPDIMVIWHSNRWTVTGMDGTETRYAYRNDALAKARLLRLAARRSGWFPQIVIHEMDGSRTLLR